MSHRFACTVEDSDEHHDRAPFAGTSALGPGSGSSEGDRMSKQAVNPWAAAFAGSVSAPRAELWQTATVESRTEAATGVVVLDLVGDLPPWEPGAHADIRLEGEYIRQYSLCGDPQANGQWRIGVLLEPSGRGGSRRIHETLQTGSTVEVRGPRNHFPLVDAPAYHFIGGGIGITPLLSMIAEADTWGVPWRLDYGGRTESSMAFVDELARYGDKVHLHPQDKVGLLAASALLSDAAEGTAVYCCGPEPLIDAVERACAAAGLELHVERFAPIEVDTSKDTTIEVEFAQAGITIEVPPDQSIIAAAEEHGIFITTSCGEGTCGSCETRVIAGTPLHRDAVLTPDEKAAGDAMMPCVSRAFGGRLVLDL